MRKSHFRAMVWRALDWTISRLSRFTVRQRSATGAYYPQQPSCQIPELWFLYTQFLGQREQGQFVEIGAYDGVTLSNTWGLAARGWNGLLIEPVPEHAAQCRINHHGHPNVLIVESAVGPPNQEHLLLTFADTLSTANSLLVKEYSELSWAQDYVAEGRQVSVPSKGLGALLAEHSITPGFDVLSVDVEGYEAVVFSSLDLEYWRPKMVIVELVETHPDLTTTTTSDARLCLEIMESDYVIVFKDIINTVFVDRQVWKLAFRLSA